MSKYSKFWPKGGLPGILHHYVSAILIFTTQAHEVHPEEAMLELIDVSSDS